MYEREHITKHADAMSSDEMSTSSRTILLMTISNHFPNESKKNTRMSQLHTCRDLHTCYTSRTSCLMKNANCLWLYSMDRSSGRRELEVLMSLAGLRMK